MLILVYNTTSVIFTQNEDDIEKVIQKNNTIPSSATFF